MQKKSGEHDDDDNLQITEYIRNADVQFSGSLNFDLEAIIKQQQDAVDRRQLLLTRQKEREEEEARLAKEKKRASSASSKKRIMSANKKSAKMGEKESENSLEEKKQFEVETEQMKIEIEKQKLEEEEAINQQLYKTDYMICYLNYESLGQATLHYTSIVSNRFRVVTQHQIQIPNISVLKSYETRKFNFCVVKIHTLVSLEENSTTKRKSTPKTALKPRGKSQQQQREKNISSLIKDALVAQLKIDEDSCEIVQLFGPLPLLNLLIGKSRVFRKWKNESVFQELSIRYAIDQPLVDSRIQKELCPMAIKIPWVRNLPNEPWLPERCKPVYITCDFLDTKIITEAKNHDVNIEFDFFTIAYMRDLEKYRNFFETNPLSFYIHDRDPSDGSHCGYVGRADFWLTSLLSAIEQELILVSPVYHYELEPPPETPKQEQTPVVKSKKQQTKKPNSKKGKKAKDIIVEEESPILPDIKPIVINRGSYEQKQSEMKLVVQVSNKFPPILPQNRIFPVVVVTNMIHVDLVNTLENLVLNFTASTLPIEDTPELVRSGSRTCSRKTRSRVSQSRPASNSSSRSKTPVPERIDSSRISISVPRFNGYEVCDGEKRIVVIETSLELAKHIVNHLSTQRDIRLIFNPNCFYSASKNGALFEQNDIQGPTVQENQKEQRTSCKKGSRPGSRNVNRIPQKEASELPPIAATSIETSKKILRIRLVRSLNQILVENKIYKKKRREQGFAEAAVKLSRLSDVKYMHQILDNRLLPSTGSINELREIFSDDSLIEQDQHQAYLTLKMKEEELVLEESYQNEEEIDEQKEIKTVDDLLFYCGQEMRLTGIPLFDPPMFLPKADMFCATGSEERIRSMFKSLKNYPNLQITDIREQLLWSYVQDLSGYILILFPPFYTNLPPLNVQSEFVGVITEATRKRTVTSEPKRIFPFRERETSIRFNSQSAYCCLIVSEWSQVASKTVDSKLPAKYLRSRSQVIRNHIRDNKTNVIALKGASRTAASTTSSGRTSSQSGSFYLFNKQKDQLGGDLYIHKRSIEPVTQQERLYHDHLYSTYKHTK